MFPSGNNSGLTEIDSTLSPLTAGINYKTSSFKNCRGAKYIVGTCKADQSGILKIIFSSDGANEDGEESYSYFGSAALPYEIPVVSPFCKIYFENTSGVDQTYLRLYAWGKR